MASWFAKRAGSGAGSEEARIADLLRRASEHQSGAAEGMAEECYREILSMRPEHSDARRLLARLVASRAHEHQESGELAAAIEGYEESLALDQSQALLLNNLGNAYKSLDRLEDAITAYRDALEIDGNLAEAHLNLGSALYRTGRADSRQAISHCRLAIELRPGFAEANLTLGYLLEQEGDAIGALASYRRAIAARPEYAEAHLNLAMLLNQTGERSQAIAHCRTALGIQPSFAEASMTLGSLLENDGDTVGALQSYRDAIGARPDYAEAHYNLALQLLLRGEYESGWQEYEWRMRVPGFRDAWPHPGPVLWDGSPLEGKTILLFSEQGLGDVILFVRYAQLVAGRGGKVLISCPPKLKALLETVPGVSAVFKTGDALPPFDVCVSILSLPLIFETTLETIPAEVPYVRPNAEKVRYWKARLAADDALLKIGLCWSTDTKSSLTPLRSLTLDMLAPLGGMAKVTYYSLQRGAAAPQAAHPPRGMKLVDLTPELEDFAADAALIANLDLVISINTATAQLAGAMGQRTWTLAQYPPDWRFLLGRDDSPWHPTMRLFRKGPADNWEQVVSRLGEAVRQLAEIRY